MVPTLVENSEFFRVLVKDTITFIVCKDISKGIYNYLENLTEVIKGCQLIKGIL